MRSQLAAELLAYDQDKPIRRVCRTFKDDRNSWHMWLVDADDPQAIRYLEWDIGPTACVKAVAEMARRVIELQIHTDALVAAVGNIYPLCIDHTFSDRECAALFLSEADAKAKALSRI